MDKVIATAVKRSPEPGSRTGVATKDRVRRALKKESKRELMASLGLVRVVGARGGVYYE